MKLAAGANGVEDLEARVARSCAANAKAGRGAVHTHVTRMFPRAREEVLGGGSLYWVIKGAILVRQRIIGLETQRGEDGIERCAIVLDPDLHPTEAQPRRAFQGWRYLKADDAPRDLQGRNRDVPAALRAKLAELGLL